MGGRRYLLRGYFDGRPRDLLRLPDSSYSKCPPDGGMLSQVSRYENRRIPPATTSPRAPPRHSHQPRHLASTTPATALHTADNVLGDRPDRTQRRRHHRPQKHIIDGLISKNPPPQAHRRRQLNRSRQVHSYSSRFPSRTFRSCSRLMTTSYSPRAIEMVSGGGKRRIDRTTSSEVRSPIWKPKRRLRYA